MKKIFVFANSDKILSFDKKNINSDDIVVMFNVPKRQDIKINFLFVANTIHPAKKFYRSNFWQFLQSDCSVIFPYESKTIDSFDCLEKSNKLTDLIRGWSSNGAIKITKKLPCNYNYFSFDDYITLCNKIKIKPNLHIPSTGAIAIQYCLNNYDMNEYKIYLVGFSFEGSPCHVFENEKKWVNELKIKLLD